MARLSWLQRRFINANTLAYLSEKMQPLLKEQILQILEDEEVAFAVNSYATALGDHLFERYRQKFYGSLGGVQKALNQGGPHGQQLPIYTENGDLSISSIIKSIFLGQLQRPQPSTFMSKRGRIGAYDQG